MSITITSLISPDYADWLPLWQGYLIFYQASVAPEVTAQSFTRMTSGKDSVGGFLARDEQGQAIGLTHWILHRSNWTLGDYCYLQDLFVAPHVRGGGVGRALITQVYTHAKTQNCSRVYWLTKENNVAAQKLYDKIADKSGFIQYVKTA